MKKDIEKRWLESYHAICKYIETHQCSVSDIPKTVTDKNGVVLREWFYRQIRCFMNVVEDSLSDEQKEMLVNIGIQDYLTAKDQKWFEHLREMIAYYEKHHLFVVPKDFPCADGTMLRNWLMNQKAAFVKGKLREDRMLAIVDSGMIGMLDTRTESTMHHLEKFYQEHGHINVPADYVSKSGVKLGRFVRMLRTQKNNGELSQEIIDQLDALGMIWDKHDYFWNETFEICREYYTKYGNLDFTEEMAEQEAKRLASWIQANRYKYLHGELSKERTGLLYNIGALDVNLFPK